MLWGGSKQFAGSVGLSMFTTSGTTEFVRWSHRIQAMTMEGRTEFCSLPENNARSNALGVVAPEDKTQSKDCTERT